MKQINRFLRPAVSLLMLTGEYLLVRGPLFYLHGMMQWPQILALAAAAGILLSVGLDLKNLDLFSAAGYGCGFMAGLLFHQYGTDPGGSRTDNLWLIWATMLLTFMCIGLATAIRAGSAGREKE